ncbi:GCN5-related N-acetyltransferase [Thermoanaerobacterium xylanolyticum LX-11]|uniref:GCN5-related N-acetyltransferase n=1 Tax=Thermoanaerobacterium xylanolyticum (strain ATCC 49914 / DSM 7097 / LX-11) TaxID=858215 RepID=F6BLL1_THEXL|nr:GNAT family N-acetyltransferase [Thermoanaerobacterium xylanolyticum]AEF17258.1 GCN5-related N-acetyltransferase [Thermoanaerobacterium xylanolyticum LX-11]
MFKIKFASEEDLKYIKKIADYFKLSLLVDLNKCINMIATDEKPFGFITIKVDDDTAYIIGHAVLPEYQMKGYGTMLLKVALNNVYDFGIKKACVKNSISDDFYIGNHFKKSDNGLYVDIEELLKK